MGLLRKFLGKEIKLDSKFYSELVYPSLLHKKIKLGTTLIVPENYAFVIANDGKVLDTFNQGETILDKDTLKEVIKKLRLKKFKNKKELNDKIKVDGYFVNLNQNILSWKTYRKMSFKDEDYGNFKARANGELLYKINDATLFIKTLLLVYAYLKKGEGKKLLTNFISEYMTNNIEKNNYPLEMLNSKTKEISLDMVENLQKKFLKYGVDIQNLYIREFDLPKNIVIEEGNTYSLEDLKNNSKEEVENNMSNEENKKETFSAFPDYGIEIEEKKEVKEETKSVFDDYKDDKFYEDYKDNDFETTPYKITNPFTNENVEANNEIVEEKEEETEKQPKSVFGNYGNWNLNKKTENKQSKFVDLSLETLYDEEKEK